MFSQGRGFVVWPQGRGRPEMGLKTTFIHLGPVGSTTPDPGAIALILALCLDKDAVLGQRTASASYTETSSF